MTIKIIDLLNKIANGEIEDKRTFKILFPNKIHRSIYYDDNEPNCLWRLKNVSDDEPIQDAIEFNDEIEIIEEQQDIDIQEIDIQKIEELPQWVTRRDGEVTQQEGKRLEMAEKINKLIQAVKQLDKQIKEKE